MTGGSECRSTPSAIFTPSARAYRVSQVPVRVGGADGVGQLLGRPESQVRLATARIAARLDLAQQQSRPAGGDRDAAGRMEQHQPGQRAMAHHGRVGAQAAPSRFSSVLPAAAATVQRRPISVVSGSISSSCLNCAERGVGATVRAFASLASNSSRRAAIARSVGNW
ncbi:hypothetical protein GCM10018954_100260 [Kutzneria kofuensis]